MKSAEVVVEPKDAIVDPSGIVDAPNDIVVELCELVAESVGNTVKSGKIIVES